MTGTVTTIRPTPGADPNRCPSSARSKAPRSLPSVFCLAGLLLTGVSGFHASAISPSARDSMGYYLVQQHYVKAQRVLAEVLRNNPQDMEALYLYLAAMQTRILDYESYVIDGAAYLPVADSVCRVFQEKLHQTRGRDSLDCLFYLGNTLGGKAVVQAKTGSWLSAIKTSVKSTGYLRRVVEIDSSYYGAYLGVGIFNYYLSQNLKWLPFFGDRRREGIAQIQKATKATFPFDLAAKNSLCWIYVERDRYRDADSLCLAVLKQYPNSTVFLRIAADIALWTNRPELALSRAEHLVALSYKADPTNWSNLLCGYRIVVEASWKLGRTKRCLAAADSAAALKIGPEHRKIHYVQEHLDAIIDIRKQCKSKGEPKSSRLPKGG